MSDKPFSEWDDDALVKEWEACDLAISGGALIESESQRALQRQIDIEHEWDIREQNEENQ